MAVRFLPVGDTALNVEFGETVDRALSRRVLQLDRLIRSSAPTGIVETVPSFRSLLVHYDPLLTGRADLETALAALIDTDAGPAQPARLWRIPVCYEPSFAPDLAEVAAATGFPVGKVVRLHSSIQYHVYMLGFLPGFPYLGDLPAELALPRRADPRVRVPAGSIAVATCLTAIYPFESPGGWHLIGTTPLKLFNATQTPPTLLAPGDAVRFEPIDAVAFARIESAVEAGSHLPASEPIPP
jgi:inhibitor of KinA